MEVDKKIERGEGRIEFMLIPRKKLAKDIKKRLETEMMRRQTEENRKSQRVRESEKEGEEYEECYDIACLQDVQLRLVYITTKRKKERKKKTHTNTNIYIYRKC